MSFNQLDVKDIVLTYKKIYENACELIEEAEILFIHQKYARAFLCAHISIEEFGKLPMLTSVALNIYNGVKIDWKELNKRIRNHKKKTSSSQSIQMIMEKVLFDFEYENIEEKITSIDDTEKEKYYDLNKFKDFLASIDFYKLKKDSLLNALLDNPRLHEDYAIRTAVADLLNDYKNHSLYSDFYKEEFKKPSEVIDRKRCMRRIMMALFQKKFNDFINIQNRGFALYKYEDIGFDQIIAKIKKRINEK
ncbi:AbiV family abortive infection protein [Fictibacillus phosphorivorans]|uniref:AbiV family abortive infection protein n=1 Tax=Fictibacillus phosphorivorans TaxID=1221500 RepID=UPI0035EEE7FA